ncbi:MAG TPA: thioredoxin domain-containing protein [Longimicrobiales bacterium]|nr:thioredoxin domain-containing protein [Longimicrobiales bacterium]
MSNRLAAARSPYLRQHAHNPVDWYPWGEEALGRARDEDRPILLSIGYSACHWCHVMERESFDDPDTAARMNRGFVCIKVDREERPDVDGIYMKAVQAMTGGGGWPLTVFLTPGGEPFYGGTYYPPEPRHGMPSFRQVLDAIREAWENRRDQLQTSAARLTEALERSAVEADATPGGPEEAPEPEALVTAAERHLASRFDPDHGGFGPAPKFPQPMTLEFLLARGEPRTVAMVVRTLQAMSDGGIRDHLGGGFHRYAVDARWLVPHFEKMLYDNALLARVYLEAWRITGDEALRDTAVSTLDYVVSDLRHPEGGFYAARDADSEGEEGLFYLWTPDQVEAALDAAGVGTPEDRALFRRLYDVSPGGNFEGRSILHLPHPRAAVARSAGLDPAELDARLAPLEAALLEARSRREPPFRDEKVIAAWSAMAVRALAEAAPLVGRPDFLEAARDGARFLLDRMTDGRGGVQRIWIDGAASGAGFLEDHGALGNALLSLHASTLEPDWLRAADAVCARLLDDFWDPEAELFQDAPLDGERLVARARDLTDGATPSGNSLAVELLLRAGHLLDRPTWIARARAVLAREGAAMARVPGAFGRLLTQLVRDGTEPMEVAILGPPGPPRDALLEATLSSPHRNLAVSGGDPAADDLEGFPLLRGRGAVDGRPAAWICRRFTCRAPVTEPAEVVAALAEAAGD